MGELLRLLNAPCRDIAALVSAAMDGNLRPSQRWAVRIHLVYCRACRAYKRQCLFLHRVLQLAMEQVRFAEPDGGARAAAQPASALSLSPEARQRMQNLLSDR